MRIWIVLALALAPTFAFAWEVIEGKSAFDDSPTVAAIKEAEATYTNRYGRSGRANLQIVCEENRTALALVLPELYTSDNGNLGRVTFRVDAASSFEEGAISANDHGSLALLGGDAIRTIRKMLGGEKLLVRLLTVNESAKTIEFSVSGIDEAVSPVREACGW